MESEQQSQLPKLRSHHKVRVYNPLDEPFTHTFGRSIIQEDYNKFDQRYIDKGLTDLKLRNDETPLVNHVIQPVTIPAQSSINMMGDVAQVIVKHLIDAVMYKRYDKKLKGNAELRLTIEKEVIPEFEDLRKQLDVGSFEEAFAKQMAELNPITEQSNVADEVTEEAFANTEQPAFESVIPKNVTRKQTNTAK